MRPALPQGQHQQHQAHKIESYRYLSEEERKEVWLRMDALKAEHAAMKPLERRAKSYARGLAYGLASLKLQNMLRRGSEEQPLSVWVLNATSEVEVFLAEADLFLDANFLDDSPMDIILIGDKIRHGIIKGSQEPGEKKPPRVRTVTWDLLQGLAAQSGTQVRPDVSVIFEDIHIFSKWCSSQPKSKAAFFERNVGHITLVMSRSKIDEDLAQTFSHQLGERYGDPVKRNIFSGQAGDERSEYDDNGWVFMLRGLDTVIEASNLVAAHKSGEKRISGSERDLSEKRISASFWGIIDLKYDPTKNICDRVKVLETGDGRSSKFSHAGAEIPKRFRDKYKLDEGASSGKHAVVSANKKLTHDLMQYRGYEHLVPKQVCHPRVYDPSLAERIITELGASSEDILVLKLCNRSRAAGVLPVPASELDSVLKEVLQPPEKIETWLRRERARGISETISSVETGSYQEQLRHWWSNECPHFVVEEFCTSIPTEAQGKLYDGTMRIAFALHKRSKNPEHGRSNEQGQHNDPLMEFAPAADELEVDWIGGYWKLPKEDMDSLDLRKSVISAARTSGTAYVANHQLQEVYAAMGDSVQQLFGGSEPSPKMLTDWYKDQPELATYLTARLAIAMKDLSRVRMALKLASSVNVKAEAGPVKQFAESFLNRGYGILEAQTPPHKWKDARECFAESVEKVPTNAASLYLLGMAELELENLKEAENLMHRSVILDLDFKAPYVNLGVVYLRLRKYDDAITASEACLKRHPDSPQCHYHIGVACYQKAVQQESGHRRGLADTIKEIDTLRKRAFEELSAARESEDAQRLSLRGLRGGPGRQDSPWLDTDDKMLENLKKTRSASGGVSGRLEDITLPSNVGWRFFGWRN